MHAQLWAFVMVMRTPVLKSIILFALFAGCFLSAKAQADVDSPYSLFGIGQVNNGGMNVRLKGMGGTANAMFGGGLINSVNPASYGKIDSLAFLFDAGFYFKSSTFSTSSLSENASNASFDQVALCFGATDWWKMAIGVQPFTTSGYTMLVDDVKPGVGKTTTRFKGSGGLNRAFWGNAFNLGKHFSLGVNAYYAFGDSQVETSLYFPDSAYVIGSRHSVDVLVRSFMFDYGALFNTQVGDDMELGVGLTYTQQINLKGNQTMYIRSFQEDLDTEIEYLIDTVEYGISTMKITMPQGFGVGLSLKKGNNWAVGADFNWTQWSKFAIQGKTEGLQNSWRVSAGAELTPRHTSISGYFSRVTYRFGGFYDHGYITLLGNDGLEHSINRMGVTVGLTLPLPRTLSTINLSLEAGQYGTREGGLIQERYAKLDVGVSVFEHWFMKRKYK